MMVLVANCFTCMTLSPRRIRANIATDDDDSSEEQYPPADEKYKQLKDRLKVVEVQAVPGLNLGDMGLVSGVVIPPKLKIPTFVTYDGVSYPKMHLRSYVRKIQPYTTDLKL